MISLWWSSVVSTTSMTARLGCVAQWGLDDGGVLINTCRVVAPFGAVAASMAGLVKILTSTYTLEMGSRKMVVVTSGACAQGANLDFAGEWQ